jgi:hypothetical protein
MQPCPVASCLASLASSLTIDAVSQNSTCLPSQRGHDAVRLEVYVLPTSHMCNMLDVSPDKDFDRYPCDEFPINILLFLHLRRACRCSASEDPSPYQ